MATSQQKRQQFVITEAIVTSDRSDIEREVNQYISELVIFEDIRKPYITGKIALIDDRGIFSNEIGFKGSETLTVTIEGVDPNNPTSITHSFLMTSIERVYKTNEKTEVYVFGLIDKHVFFDANKKISKSYSGKIEDIVTAIIVSELGKTVDRSYTNRVSLQENLKVVIPYLSPLQACQWLINRATTENGSPYYLYASLYDENLRLGDFDTQYSLTPFNANLPLIYSPAVTNATVDGDPTLETIAIKDVRYQNIQDTLKMIASGSVGSKITNFDISRNYKLENHHKLSSTLSKLQQENVIPNNAKQNIFDDKQVVSQDVNNPVYVDDADAREFYKLSSVGTYNSFNSYQDTLELSDVGDINRSIAILGALDKNIIDIQIPGALFFIRQVTVGDTVSVNFLNSNSIIEELTPDQKLNTEKSGNYLIYSIRHTFSQTTHDISASLTKLNTKPSDAPQ